MSTAKTDARESGSCSTYLRNFFNNFLLPLKFLFFFQFGAAACLLPYTPVFIKSLGLNAAEMGMIFGAMPFMALLSKPIAGFITDKSRKPYRLLHIFFFLKSIFMFSMYFVPPMTSHLPQMSNCTTLLSNAAYSGCVISANGTEILLFEHAGPEDIEIPVVSTDTTVIRSTPQLWMIGTLMAAAWFATGAVAILEDAVTITLIAQSPVPSSYGENRVFGTLGWATFAVAVGLIMDQFSIGTSDRDFTPAYVAYAITSCIGLITTFLLPVLATKAAEVVPVGKAVLKRFFTCDVLLFSFGSLIMGANSGLVHAYLGWYQAELGASSFLIGLTVFVECCYEVPMMALSDWLIKKLGYHHCMLLCISSFGARFMCYSLIDNPWLVLPVDILHSLGYGLFYPTKTSFAYAKAPKGSGATLQGLLGAIFDGVGQGTGVLVAGILYQKFGGKRTWMGYGLFTFSAAALYFVGTVFIWVRSKRRRARRRQLPMDESQILQLNADDPVIKPINAQDA